jgi:hypothetical protein
MSFKSSQLFTLFTKLEEITQKEKEKISKIKEL